MDFHWVTKKHSAIKKLTDFHWGTKKRLAIGWLTVKRLVIEKRWVTRKLMVKRDARFHQHEDCVWNLIEDEVKKTMMSDRSTRDRAASGRGVGA